MSKYNNKCIGALLSNDTQSGWSWESALHKEKKSETDKVKYLYSFMGFSFCGKGGLQMLCGAEKSGKSTVISNLVCAALAGECGSVVCNIDNAKVLLCDTEQGHSGITEMKDYIKKVSGVDNLDDVFAVRDLSLFDDVEEIKNDIWNSVKYFRPDIVIIDCGTDLVEDTITSEKDCKDVIKKLQILSINTNCSILIVVHFKPYTTQPRGHFGAELARRATDIITAELVYNNGKGINKVKFVEKRGRADNKQNDVCILWSWNEDFKPYIYTEKLQKAKTKKSK